MESAGIFFSYVMMDQCQIQGIVKRLMRHAGVQDSIKKEEKTRER
jgi:hypothetical protein